MNRRGFLGGMLAAASTMVLDPEKLLWRPEAKTIFIPKAKVLPRFELNPMHDGVYANFMEFDIHHKGFLIRPDEAVAIQNGEIGFVRSAEGVWMPRHQDGPRTSDSFKVNYSPSLAS